MVIAGIVLFFLNYQGLFAKGFGVNLIALHPDRVIYPFTYVGAGLSFFVLFYYIFKAERKKGKMNFLGSLMLGGLVADISSVGMLNVFEQVFVTFNQFAHHSDYWFIAYWGTPAAALSTAIGLGFVFESMPWWTRRNLMPVFASLALFAGGIVVWYLLGFPSETSGVLIYSINAITRISSQMVLVLLVLPFKIRIPRREMRAGGVPPSKFDGRQQSVREVPLAETVRLG